jgi:TPR repeat protein
MVLVMFDCKFLVVCAVFLVGNFDDSFSKVSKKGEGKVTEVSKNTKKLDLSAKDLVGKAEKEYYKKNIKKALALFNEAAEKGSGYACRRLGLEYSDYAFERLTPNDNVKAAQWFRKGADLNDPESMFYLSEFLFQGKGVQKDEQQGTEMLIKAAKSGSEAAAHRAVKLERNKKLKLSKSDKEAFCKLDKHFRDAITLR